MTTSVGGVTAYSLSVRGTKTKFIRASVATAADVVTLDAAETTGGSTKGYQTVEMYPIAVAGNATGLANDATVYTCSINFDGVATPVSVAGNVSQTFTALIAAIETDIGAAGTISIVAGNLKVASDGTAGNGSYVTITDTNLFSSLTGYLRIATGVEGGLEGVLRSTTLGNGANAYAAYVPYAEMYDTAAARTVNNTAATALITSVGTGDGTVADVGGAFSQTTLNNNFKDLADGVNALVTKVNALQTELKSQTR